MLRTEVVKLCLDNNFNSGFFEGSGSNNIVDVYELKVIFKFHLGYRIVINSYFLKLNEY